MPAAVSGEQINWFGLARPSGQTAQASPPQISFAPETPKLSQRWRTRSVGRPSPVPSQPSMGWMAKRFPMRRPEPASMGCARGDPGAARRSSSQGTRTPRVEQWARNSAALLNVETRLCRSRSAKAF